jgi:hypothetical protein
VYTPLLVTVPTAALPPGMLSTENVTLLSGTVHICAWKVWSVDTRIDAAEGNIPSEGRVVIVILAVDETVGSAWLIALIVWVPSVAGGVYKPPVEIVPTSALPFSTLSTYQVTAVFVVVFTTPAVNCCVCDGSMQDVIGWTYTLTGPAWARAAAQNDNPSEPTAIIRNARCAKKVIESPCETAIRSTKHDWRE